MRIVRDRGHLHLDLKGKSPGRGHISAFPALVCTKPPKKTSSPAILMQSQSSLLASWMISLAISRLSTRWELRKGGFIVPAADSSGGGPGKAQGRRAGSCRCSTPTGEDLISACRGKGHRVITIPLSKVELGLAIGKSQRGYVMIKDKGIAKRIIALLEEMEEGAYDEDENL